MHGEDNIILQKQKISFVKNVTTQIKKLQSFDANFNAEVTYLSSYK